MNRFFADKIENGTAYLTEEDAYHLRNVLRAKTGELFEICDGVANEYIAQLVYIDKKTAQLEIKENITVEREPKHNYYICQGMPKGKKTDDVVRHGTELGMIGFYPVITQRVNVKNLDANGKIDRLQRIADEAAKQAKRICIPTVFNPVKLTELLNIPSETAVKIIAWEEEKDVSLKTAMSGFSDSRDVYILIGPEGGLDKDEVEAAIAYGWKSVTLGKRILRTETAPLTLLSAIAYHLGDLE